MYGSTQAELRPGMVTLTWTSMNIDSYKAHVHHGLKRLEQLVTGINDVIEHRIENNLKVVSRTRLVDLPDDQSFTVDDFVHNQHDHIEVEVDVLTGKNLEIEAAVDDLVQVRYGVLLPSYAIDATHGHRTMPGVVSFSSLSWFGPRRGVPERQR